MRARDGREDRRTRTAVRPRRGSRPPGGAGSGARGRPGAWGASAGPARRRCGRCRPRSARRTPPAAPCARAGPTTRLRRAGERRGGAREPVRPATAGSCSVVVGDRREDLGVAGAVPALVVRRAVPAGRDRPTSARGDRPGVAVLVPPAPAPGGGRRGGRRSPRPRAEPRPRHGPSAARPSRSRRRAGGRPRSAEIAWAGGSTCLTRESIRPARWPGRPAPPGGGGRRGRSTPSPRRRRRPPGPTSGRPRRRRAASPAVRRAHHVPAWKTSTDWGELVNTAARLSMGPDTRRP